MSSGAEELGRRYYTTKATSNITKKDKLFYELRVLRLVRREVNFPRSAKRIGAQGSQWLFDARLISTGSCRTISTIATGCRAEEGDHRFSLVCDVETIGVARTQSTTRRLDQMPTENPSKQPFPEI
jgi:hypothetical protein